MNLPGLTPEILTIGVVQQPAHISDIPGSLEQISNAIRLATLTDVDLLVFPEAFLGGYPFESLKNPYWKQHYDGLSVTSEPIQKIQHLAKIYRKAVILPFIEKGADLETGTDLKLFSSALFIDQFGEIAEHRRKKMLSPEERFLWGSWQSQGQPPASLRDSLWGLIGINLGGEWNNDLIAPTLKETQARVYIVCGGDQSDTSQYIQGLRRLAIQAQCTVVLANQAFKRSSYSADQYIALQLDPGKNDEWLCRGGSAIIGPDGQFLVEPYYEEVGIKSARIP